MPGFNQTESSEFFFDSLSLNGSETDGRSEQNETKWVSPFGPSYPPSYLMILSLASMVGNSVIVHAVCASKTFCRPVNYMLGNLAIISIFRVIMANILFLDGGSIRQVSAWACRLYSAVIHAYSSAEGFTVIFLSISRTRIIRNPWDRETGGKALRKIAATWIIGFLIELPRVTFWEFDASQKLGDGVKRCFESQQVLGSILPWITYVTLHYLLSSVLPSTLLVREIITLITDFRSIVSACAARDGQKESSRKVLQRRLMRNGIIFTSVFILINFPAGTWYFLWSLRSKILNERLTTFIYASVYPIFIIVYLNAAFFPLLIFGLSHELRNYCYKCSPGRLFEKG